MREGINGDSERKKEKEEENERKGKRGGGVGYTMEQNLSMNRCFKPWHSLARLVCENFLAKKRSVLFTFLSACKGMVVDKGLFHQHVYKNLLRAQIPKA